MDNPTLDLILHPIRLRILTALSGNRWTVRELSKVLPDVAQATLYRHINTLADGGLVVVVEERPVRGTMERVYGLADEQAIPVTSNGLIDVSKADHLRYFVTFVMSLISEFTEYLETTEHIDFGMQGIEYRKVTLHLSDQELRELATSLNALFAPLIANRPTPRRKQRTFSTVLVSATEDHTDPD